MPILFHVSPSVGMMLCAAAILLPLLIGLAAFIPALSQRAFVWAPIAAIPAVVLSMAGSYSFDLNTVTLGVTISSVGMTSAWLFMTSVLWFCAGWYGVHYLAHDNRRGSYTFFFLGSMTGNIGLIIAGDPISFVTFFALMSFMSYGLVIHDRKPESMQAGRVYLAMAVMGEVLQFAGLIRLVFPLLGNGEPIVFQLMEHLIQPDWLTVWLIILGFGIKAGLLGVHMWLPMAHPVAPTPASAVLSGSMIAAGLIGWMNLLPLGSAAMPNTGAVLVVLGLSGAFTAAFIGAVQIQAKAVLAYSSVSQMGLLIAVFGIAMRYPESWDVLKWVVLIYAVHHAFAKCLLFLSVGLKAVRPNKRFEGILFWAGTVLSALALAGAPLTSGMAAKAVLKSSVTMAGGEHIALILSLLTFAAVGTTLLMARFVDLLKRIKHAHDHAASRAIWLPWSLLLILVGSAAWYLTANYFPDSVSVWSKFSYWIKGVWPIAAGLICYIAAKPLLQTFRITWSIPPGDIYFPIAGVASGLFGFIAQFATILIAVVSNSLQFVKEFVIRISSRVFNGAVCVETRLQVWRFSILGATAAGIVIFMLSFW